MEDMAVNKAYLYQKIADYNQKVAEQSPEDMAGLVGWPKIMAKAQRLRKAGMVELTANQPNYVSANVTGDHGSYISEIWRENPESQKISNWQCTCPWFQYAFGRTRQWKKLEGRTCSHVLATYWEGLSQPLSVEQPQQQPPQEPEMEIPDAPANYQNLQQTRNFPAQAPVQGDTGYLNDPNTQRMTRTIEDALKYGSRYYNRNDSSGGSYYHGSRNVNNFTGKYTQES